MEIITRLKVSDLTKQNYGYKFKKIVEYGIDYKQDQNVIINKLESMDDKYNNISGYLNIVIVLRKAVDLSVNELVYYRDERRIFNEQTEFGTARQTETNIANKMRGLPSYEDLYNFMNNLYESGNYKGFIVNYLLLNFNVRNKDLDLIITDKPVEGNYILLGDSDALYVRNNYKTVNTYGSKKAVIKEPAFLYACRELGYGGLLTTVNKNQEVRDLTMNKIGQGRYFKVITSESSINDLKRLSSNRGTAVGTIVDYYS